jgi:hypothetical protein
MIFKSFDDVFVFLYYMRFFIHLLDLCSFYAFED